MQTRFAIATTGQGLYEFTGEVRRFVAGAGIDRAPTLRRPGHDFDFAGVGIVDETAVRPHRLVIGDDQRHVAPG